MVSSKNDKKTDILFQNLLLELRNYEENQKAAQMDRPSGLGNHDQQQMGIIPVGGATIAVFTSSTFVSEELC